MACESNMKKFIYLTMSLFVLSSLQAKEGVLTKIDNAHTLHFKVDNKTEICKMAFINTVQINSIKSCTNISKNLMLDAQKSTLKHANELLKVGNKYSYSNYFKNNQQICEVSLGDGITYNEKMLVDGYAVLWPVEKKQQDEENFNSVLIYAKNNNNGLWKKTSKKTEVMKCLDKLSNNNNTIVDTSYKSK